MAINPMVHAIDPAVVPVGEFFWIFGAEFSAGAFRHDDRDVVTVSASRSCPHVA